jgi:hypothetical protein
VKPVRLIGCRKAYILLKGQIVNTAFEGGRTVIWGGGAHGVVAYCREGDTIGRNMVGRRREEGHVKERHMWSDRWWSGRW